MALLPEAGKYRLDRSLLLCRQNTIVEERYPEKDYRASQVYVGQTLAPNRELIHFVAPKPEDVPSFMEAWLAAAEKLLDSSCDAVMRRCSCLYFVFIYPPV